MSHLSKKINIFLFLVLVGTILVAHVQKQTRIREFAQEPALNRVLPESTHTLWGYVYLDGAVYKGEGTVIITGPLNSPFSTVKTVPIIQGQAASYYLSGFLPEGAYIVTFDRRQAHRFQFKPGYGPSFMVSIGQDSCLTNYHPDASCTVDGIGNISNLNFSFLSN